jgi:uncharacterized protein YjiS (DUF1127 family)
MTYECEALVADSRPATLARTGRVLRDALANVTALGYVVNLFASATLTVTVTSARGWKRYRRRREARAIRGALSDLDDRTLCDLGFHRSEIGSIAAEAVGEAEWTRVRAPLRPRAPR